MRKIDNKLTYKKYMKIRYLWPYSKLVLPLSLMVFKVSGTVRIIEASTAIRLVSNIRKSFKVNV